MLNLSGLGDWVMLVNQFISSALKRTRVASVMSANKNVSVFSPLTGAMLISTLVERRHGLICGADLHLSEICFPIVAMWTACCIRGETVKN